MTLSNPQKYIFLIFAFFWLTFGTWESIINTITLSRVQQFSRFYRDYRKKEVSKSGFIFVQVFKLDLPLGHMLFIYALNKERSFEGLRVPSQRQNGPENCNFLTTAVCTELKSLL